MHAQSGETVLGKHLGAPPTHLVLGVDVSAVIEQQFDYHEVAAMRRQVQAGLPRLRQNEGRMEDTVPGLVPG